MTIVKEVHFGLTFPTFGNNFTLSIQNETFLEITEGCETFHKTIRQSFKTKHCKIFLRTYMKFNIIFHRSFQKRNTILNNFS